jgi:ribonuclease P protein component
VARKSPEGFPKRYRIVHGAEFRAIYNTGRKIHSEKFILFCRENKLSHHRLGVTVTRKMGGAVTRNRIKRLMREVFRRSCGEIPHHYDLVLNAKSSCLSACYWDLREELLAAIQKAYR